MTLERGDFILLERRRESECPGYRGFMPGGHRP
jgi:hypothetical protein